MSASKTKTTLASDSSSELNASNSYEQAFKELEQIVAHMESGQMSLQ
ncbi:MAG: exodeoxyribonuclease VII small subunit, partial [Methylophilales bacterium 16-45-9]